MTLHLDYCEQVVVAVLQKRRGGVEEGEKWAYLDSGLIREFSKF